MTCADSRGGVLFFFGRWKVIFTDILREDELQVLGKVA